MGPLPLVCHLGPELFLRRRCGARYNESILDKIMLGHQCSAPAAPERLEIVLAPDEAL
jgi:hypothetical protein